MDFRITEAAREAGHRFLAEFPLETARQGTACFMGGAVESLEEVKPGLEYAGVVSEDAYHRVRLIQDGPRGAWRAECGCGASGNGGTGGNGGGVQRSVGVRCWHVYACMKMLLTAPVKERLKELNRVNRDRAGEPVVASGPAASRVRAPGRVAEKDLGGEGFGAELEGNLGRSLGVEEKKYCESVDLLYRRVQGGGALMEGDLEPLGLKKWQRGWDRLRLWSTEPRNVREFCRYLLAFMEGRGVPVPEFLLGLGSLEVEREKIQGLRREAEVDRWRRLLTNLSGVEEAEPSQVSLRLRFGKEEAVVEVQREGTLGFEAMKSREFRELQNLVFGDFAEESGLLAQWLQERSMAGDEPVFKYSDPEDAQILEEIIRAQQLGGLLVWETGEIVERREQSLEWRLEEAERDGGDYRLWMAYPDGNAAGPFLLVSHGRPMLYLTQTGIWHGPAVDTRVIDPGVETRIPAQALETGSGAHLLRRLGVGLPERMRERVGSQQVEVLMVCDVRPTWAGATEESCTVEVTAKSPDGRVKMVYGVGGWRQRAEIPEGGDDRVDYDLSHLRGVDRCLERLPLKWDGVHGHWHFKVTRKFAEVFSEWLAGVPAWLRVELRGELESFREGPLKGSIRLEVEEASVDWFDLRVVLDVDDTKLTPQELKVLLDARGGWVRLGGKGWRKLEFDLSEADDEQLARLGLSARDFSSEPQRVHALQLADKAARRFLSEDHCERLERRQEELMARVNPPVPAELRAELRPYQLEGFHFLAYLSANRFGGVLADDMGLGKTVQTLAWIAWLRAQDREALPVLVVCPKSVCDNWRSEVERFLPRMRVKVWSGAELESICGRIGEADLHVINYAQLRSVGEGLAEVPFLAAILDEGQFIKNPSSATAKFARGLRASHRLVLSGTPIENRLMDLWSLMAFAMPGVLGGRADFGKLYGDKEDPLARRRLSARVRPFVLRRTKGQVAKDLPDRVEEDLYCVMEGEQRTLYRAELKRAQQMLLRVKTQKQLARERFHVLSSLMRLRQICCDPRLVKPDCRGVGAKLEALLEQLEPLMEEGQKVLVFSQFVEMLGLLRGAIEEHGWKQFYLAGDTEDRGELVRRFQETEGASVFLISLKAGGFGLNLTSASYVVLFDPWWNPAVENQAIDRTHRIGQVNKVVAYRLLIKDSIEEKIRALQSRKRALAEDVLGEDQFAQNLSLDDLHQLFSEPADHEGE
jgi:hypothetical protein